jgi:DNA-binding NarL/FixJ family response regulator
MPFALPARARVDTALVNVDLLPDHGRELVHHLLETPDIAFLIFSAADSTRKQSEYLHAGPADYLPSEAQFIGTTEVEEAT